MERAGRRLSSTSRAMNASSAFATASYCDAGGTVTSARAVGSKQKSETIAMNALAILVPKLCLGTHIRETLFRVLAPTGNGVSCPCVPKQEFEGISHL